MSHTRLVALLVGSAALAVVLLSPFAMDALGGSGADWGRLGQIGAAYGFTSALVAALALCGVDGSLLQAPRQAKADQAQAIRSYYLELARMQLDDMLLYQPCWGPTDLGDERAMRRHVHCDLMMNYACR